MPINDPIRDRKIALNSLAFREGGSRGGAVVSYQQTLIDLGNTTIISADSEIQRRDRNALTIADRDAEYRSKSWVGGWHRVIDWDIGTNVFITNNAWHPITFSHEVMRAMGVQYNSAGVGAWRWRIPPDYDGTWFLHLHLSVQAPSAAAVQSAQIGFAVNGTLRTVVDRADKGMAGEDPMRDVILGGSRNIALGVGDILTAVVYFDGAAGGTSYGHPSSIVGYISGHRVRCDGSHSIDTSDDISGYVFV